MKKHLLFFILVLSAILNGCATQQQGVTESEFVEAYTEVQRDGEEDVRTFQREAELGMSPDQAEELMASISNIFDDGKPGTRNLKSENGITVETWEYEFISEKLILVFHEDELFEMKTENIERDDLENL